MKLPGYAPSTPDRVSTREELFQVLELLGGFEEPQDTEPGPACDLLGCLETGSAAFPAEPAEELSEERLLVEVETFNSLRGKAERIN